MMKIMRDMHKQLKERDDAFAEFIDQPAIRLLMSMVKPTDVEGDQSVLKTLLQEAHAHGYSSGMCSVLGEIVGAIQQEKSSKS